MVELCKKTIFYIRRKTPISHFYWRPKLQWERPELRIAGKRWLARLLSSFQRYKFRHFFIWDTVHTWRKNWPYLIQERWTNARSMATSYAIRSKAKNIRPWPS
jgi:hypothetical protein